MALKGVTIRVVTGSLRVGGTLLGNIIVIPRSRSDQARNNQELKMAINLNRFHQIPRPKTRHLFYVLQSM